MKESYERADLEILRFRTEDVITTSGPADEYEGWNPQTSDSQSSGEYEGWNPHQP